MRCGGWQVKPLDSFLYELLSRTDEERGSPTAPHEPEVESRATHPCHGT